MAAPKFHWSSKKTHCKNGHEFTLENTYARNGTRSCRACHKNRSKSWTKTHPSTRTISSRKYNNSDKRRKVSQKFNTTVKRINSNLKKYGITYTEYEQIFKSQNSLCAICEKEIYLRGKLTHVDHDHKTGKVRGILCLWCNNVLGYCNDNIFILEKAISYVKYN